MGGGYSDLIVGGAYVFHFEGDGTCKIRDPADGFKIIAENMLEPGANAIPVFEGRRMYVRTDLSLFCIEESEK